MLKLLLDKRAAQKSQAGRMLYIPALMTTVYAFELSNSLQPGFHVGPQRSLLILYLVKRCSSTGVPRDKKSLQDFRKKNKIEVSSTGQNNILNKFNVKTYSFRFPVNCYVCRFGHEFKSVCVFMI